LQSPGGNAGAFVLGENDRPCRRSVRHRRAAAKRRDPVIQVSIRATDADLDRRIFARDGGKNEGQRLLRNDYSLSRSI
jgi:hypothetical protein